MRKKTLIKLALIFLLCALISAGFPYTLGILKHGVIFDSNGNVYYDSKGKPLIGINPIWVKVHDEAYIGCTFFLMLTGTCLFLARKKKGNS